MASSPPLRDPDDKKDSSSISTSGKIDVSRIVSTNMDKVEQMLGTAEGEIMSGAKSVTKDVILKVQNFQLPPLPDPANTIKIDSRPLIAFSERLNNENKYFSSLIRSHPAFIASVVSFFVVVPSALFGKRAVLKSVVYSFVGAYGTKAMFDWKWSLAPSKIEEVKQK